MPLQDEIREKALIELAHTRFDPNLSDPELKILHDSANSADLPVPAADAPSLDVRAEFIRWLATDLGTAPNIDPKGLQVMNATITGTLDLSECRVHSTLVIYFCRIPGGINLRNAETRGIHLLGCAVDQGIVADGVIVNGPFFFRASQSTGIIRILGAQIKGVLDYSGSKLTVPGVAIGADGADIGGSLFLNQGFESSGEIRLLGAKVRSDLDCSSAKLTATGNAFSADGVNVGGSIFLNQGFESSGANRLLGAKIAGTLDCSTAKFTAKDLALSLERVEIGGAVFLNQDFQSSGSIRMLGAQIKGVLDCSTAKLTAAGIALYADGSDFGSNIFLNMGFESSGSISLLGATVKRDLDCSGAKLTATGPALSADGATFGGSVFLNRNFESSGTIRLVGAKIAGTFDCSTASLTAKEGALFLDRVEVDGAVFLNWGFKSLGTICLPGARINSDLDCSSAKLMATGLALSVDGGHIGGTLYLNRGFECSGAIRLPRARIESDLDCSGAKLTFTGDAFLADGASVGGNVFLNQGFNSSGTVRLLGTQIGGDLTIFNATVASVTCQNMRLGGDLIWQGIQKSGNTWLNLVGAKVKNLRDTRESWPDQGKLDLDGLVYEELTLHQSPLAEQLTGTVYLDELPLVAKERISWLKLQPAGRRAEPQPWIQLSQHLEAKGSHDGAKHVLYELSCLQAQDNLIPPPRWWMIAFAWLEEAPIRILYSICLILLLGWLIFNHAGASGALAPTEAEAYKSFTTGKPMPAAYPTLNPFMYTLDNSLPLVKLGQDDKWAPDHHHPATDQFTGYWFLMWTRWLLILAGWFQATVLAAALSGRFKD